MELNDTRILSMDPVEVFRALDKALAQADTDWLEWDAEALMLQLDRHQKLITKSAAIDKILAVKSAAFNINLPCAYAMAFEKITTAFCNNVCVMDAAQPPYVEEIFYTTVALKALAREVHGSKTRLVFKGEVPGYVAAAAKHRGVLVLPKPLDFAQDTLTFLTGYAPSADEITMGERIHTLAKENPAGLMDKSALDNLTPDNDKATITLVRCYLYRPDPA